jgi:hypothetical protein
MTKPTPRHLPDLPKRATRPQPRADGGIQLDLRDQQRSRTRARDRLPPSLASTSGSLSVISPRGRGLAATTGARAGDTPQRATRCVANAWPDAV